MITLVISTLVAFFTTLIFTPILIKYLQRVGIVGIDQHKKNKPVIASSGGICVASGILTGLLTFIGIETFVTGFSPGVVDLLAIISSILIVTLVGIFDDLNVVRKKVVRRGVKEIRIGLPQLMKPLLTLPAAIPLMVVNAGSSNIALPLVGLVDVGILYPLLLIPIGVIGASNAINILGGFNGLEAGMGLSYMLGLGIFALLTNNQVAVLFLLVATALLGFIKFNWYPAKILPGDSLTYLLGAVLASGVIIGNMEKLAIVLMIPFFVELILKMRSGFKATSLGRLTEDGKIENIYGKRVYSLTHVVMNFGRFTEKQITLIFVSVETLFVLFGILLYAF